MANKISLNSKEKKMMIKSTKKISKQSQAVPILPKQGDSHTHALLLVTGRVW
jgi:hypothetical protein